MERVEKKNAKRLDKFFTDNLLMGQPVHVQCRPS